MEKAFFNSSDIAVFASLGIVFTSFFPARQMPFISSTKRSRNAGSVSPSGVESFAEAGLRVVNLAVRVVLPLLFWVMQFRRRSFSGLQQALLIGFILI
nr:hypothetical protein [Deminuibacter soli]